MAWTDFAIVAGAFFFAAFVKGTTGLGFSTIALPFLVLAVGLKGALALLVIPSMASNLFVMREAGEFRAVFARFWPLYVAAFPGIVIGLLLLDWLDPRISGAVLGAVIIAYSLFGLSQPDFRLPPRYRKPLKAPAGFGTGVVNGLTGCQVMPVLPYLLALPLPPRHMIQALNSMSTLSGIVMALGLSKLGLLTLPLALASLACLAPVSLGVFLGVRLRRHLSVEAFRKAVLAILALLGIGLIVRLAM